MVYACQTWKIMFYCEKFWKIDLLSSGVLPCESEIRKQGKIDLFIPGVLYHTRIAISFMWLWGLYQWVWSYFPSLIYCYMQGSNTLPSTVQNMINNCKRLKCVLLCHYFQLSLKPVHNRYLQQLFIFSSVTNVPDDFMASVSAHGGLVHVVMKVGYLKANGITSLVRNS